MAWGQQQEEEEEEQGVFPLKPQFRAADYAIFASMLVASMGVGVYSALRTRRNFTVSEFLFGGRKMPAVPVVLSLLGGVISAISILGNATEVYLYGTQLSVNLVGCILGVYIIRNLITPIFFKLQLASLIHYMELRFNSNVLRKLCSCCLLLSSFFYLGICLYAPSLALSSTTSFPPWASITFLGIICTIYVSIGGVRAVVYTDVLQTTLMFGGVLMVVVQVCAEEGGVSAVWDIASRGGRIEFLNLDLNPYVRHTVWSTSTLGVYFILSSVGLSQAQYQRFASVKSFEECQWVLKVFIVGLWVLWGIFYFSGLVAYATYRECDPFTSGRIDKPDQIVPYLVMDKMSSYPGLPGVFVAAVYGGVLSSMSSQANAIACLIWEDFLKDTSYFSSFAPAAKTNTVKLISAAAGLSATGMGILAGRLGTLFSVAYSVAGGIQGPLDGIFIAGIFFPWTNKRGAIAGLVLSFLFCQWRIIGKYVVGSPSPPHLPLSTAGCPENLNVTLATNVTHQLPAIQLPTSVPPHSLPEQHWLYDISYCYSGFIGTFLSLVITLVVSLLLTRPARPESLNPDLFNPTCLELYRSAWKSWDSLVHGGAEEVEKEGKEEDTGREACKTVGEGEVHKMETCNEDVINSRPAHPV